MKSKLFLSFLWICVTLFGCSKGDTGAPGATGAQGTPGNANVETNTYAISPGQWNTITPGQSYDVVIADNSITNVSTDDINVSMTSTGSNFVQLPATDVLIGGDNMGCIYSTSQVTIYYFNSTAPAQTLNFKVVVIPPAP